MALAIWFGDKRYREFGGKPGVVADLAIWVVPAGVIGGRIYHVATSPEYFFGANGQMINIFKIYEGGLGIWGAISLGGVVAFWRYRKVRDAIPFPYFLDALAPGLLIAQGVGRFGNWFNGELFGSPSTLPWALEIPKWSRPEGYTSYATYHPTFLYEALCNFALAAVLIKFTGLGKRLSERYKSGATFIFYVIGYCTYRFFIEGLRIDTAHMLFGLRLNQWVSMAVGILALIQLRRFSIIKR